MDTTPRNRRRRMLLTGAGLVGAGLLVAGPLTALAQDDDGWFADALDELVADGTIDQSQADAVSDAIAEARPERDGRFEGGHGPGWSGHHRGGAGLLMALDEASEAIGIDDDDLRDALRDGSTIAEVAEQEGVDVQTVIDAMVAEVSERLDDAVADGRIDAAEAEEHLADARERITELVNEGLPFEDRFEDRAVETDDTTDTTDSTETSDSTGTTDTTEPTTTTAGSSTTTSTTDS